MVHGVMIGIVVGVDGDTDVAVADLIDGLGEDIVVGDETVDGNGALVGQDNAVIRTTRWADINMNAVADRREPTLFEFYRHVIFPVIRAH